MTGAMSMGPPPRSTPRRVVMTTPGGVPAMTAQGAYIPTSAPLYSSSSMPLTSPVPLPLEANTPGGEPSTRSRHLRPSTPTPTRRGTLGAAGLTGGGAVAGGLMPHMGCIQTPGIATASAAAVRSREDGRMWTRAPTLLPQMATPQNPSISPAPFPAMTPNALPTNSGGPELQRGVIALPANSGGPEGGFIRKLEPVASAAWRVDLRIHTFERRVEALAAALTDSRQELDDSLHQLELSEQARHELERQLSEGAATLSTHSEAEEKKELQRALEAAQQKTQLLQQQKQRLQQRLQQQRRSTGDAASPAAPSPAVAASPAASPPASPPSDGGVDGLNLQRIDAASALLEAHLRALPRLLEDSNRTQMRCEAGQRSLTPPRPPTAPAPPFQATCTPLASSPAPHPRTPPADPTRAPPAAHQSPPPNPNPNPPPPSPPQAAEALNSETSALFADLHARCEKRSLGKRGQIRTRGWDSAATRPVATLVATPIVTPRRTPSWDGAAGAPRSREARISAGRARFSELRSRLYQSPLGGVPTK